MPVIPWMAGFLLSDITLALLHPKALMACRRLAPTKGAVDNAFPLPVENRLGSIGSPSRFHIHRPFTDDLAHGFPQSGL